MTRFSLDYDHDFFAASIPKFDVQLANYVRAEWENIAVNIYALLHGVICFDGYQCS